MCQNSLPSGGFRSLGAKISGGRGRPWGIFFSGFYKTRHILLSASANCTVLRAVVLTQYRRVTDRRTDGMRRAVKLTFCQKTVWLCQLEARRVMITLNTLSCLILKHLYSVVGIALLWCFGKNAGAGGEIRSLLIRQWGSSLDYSERFY